MKDLIVLCCLVVAVNSSMLTKITDTTRRGDNISASNIMCVVGGTQCDNLFKDLVKYFHSCRIEVHKRFDCFNPETRKEQGCPTEEVHKSCSFFQEYTCWSKEDRLERVKIAPQRLAHCKSGCFCRNGFVREYPGGPCVQASGCRDQMLTLLLDKLPKKLMNVF